jgi:hypothetical protein
MVFCTDSCVYPQFHVKAHQDLSFSMSTSLHAHILAAHTAPKHLTSDHQRFSEERFEAIFGEDNRVATQSIARRMQKLLVAESENKQFKASWGRKRPDGAGRPKEAKDADEHIAGHAPEAKFLQNMHQSFAVFPGEFLPGFIQATFQDRNTVAPGVAVIMSDPMSQSVMLLPDEKLCRASLSPDLDLAAGQSLAAVLVRVARQGRGLQLDTTT